MAADIQALRRHVNDLRARETGTGLGRIAVFRCRDALEFLISGDTINEEQARIYIAKLRSRAPRAPAMAEVFNQTADAIEQALDR